MEAGAPHKYLYLRFRGTDADEFCPPTGNKIIVYSPSLPAAQPLSVVCLGGGAAPSIRGAESAAASGADEFSNSGAREVDVFSAYWYFVRALFMRVNGYINDK